MVVVTGQQELRKENISAIVKGFALQEYRMKPLCMVDSSASWIETYYRETATELTASGTGNSLKGIPRGAGFPYGEVSWTKVSAYIEKYGLEGSISWEDENLNNIPMIARTLLRIGRAVANAVDIQIESVIAANAGNSITISTGSEWNSATIANRNPIYDILRGISEIAKDNYDPLNGNGYLCLNYDDYVALMENSKVLNNPTFKTSPVIENGRVGQICGLNIVVSNVISVSQAYIVIGKEALTWKEAMALTTEVIPDPMIKKTIRCCEMGVAQVPNPNALCTIKNTRA